MMHLLFFVGLLPTALFGMLTSFKKHNFYSYLVVCGVCIIFQSIIVGFRDVNLGQDTITYVSMFHGEMNNEHNIEPMFNFLLSAIRSISEDTLFFLIFYALIINILVFMAYESMFRGMGLFLFSMFSFTHVYWLIHVQLLRNGLASSLFVLSFALLHLGRKKISVSLALAGSMIHYVVALTAVFCLIVSRFKKLNFARNSLGLILVFLLYYAVNYIFPGMPIFLAWFDRLDAYSYYNENFFSASTISFQHIPLFFIAISFARFRKRIDDNNRSIFTFYFFIVALSTFFWSNILYRDRILLSAQLIEPVLIYLSIKNFGISDKVNVFVLLLIGSLWSLVVIFFWGPRNVLS